MGIKSVRRKKYKHSSSKSDNTERENIIKQDFIASGINQKWVTDITYIHTTNDGWVYLASVMDLFSRKIIGWVIGRRMTAELAVTALDIALENRCYPKNVVVHSDRGSQYTGELFAKRIAQCELRQSFSKKGCPYDNACIESFHHSLKSEEINLYTYRTLKEVKKAIDKYIDWYNTERIHSSNGNMSPDKYEKANTAEAGTANLD